MIKSGILIFLSMTFVLSVDAHDISAQKKAVLENLMVLSKEINVEELKAVGSSINNDEMDVVLYRLQKEIERVPEFDLNVRNEYDLRAIEALTQITFDHASKDYLGTVSYIKNLANKRLYIFPIYTELLAYQLEVVILRVTFYLEPDDKSKDELLLRLKLTEAYINQRKQMILDSVDLTKAPTNFLSYEPISCASLF